MAKFRFVYWLVEYLFYTEEFIFEWDNGNSEKNLKKHGITTGMIESSFYDPQVTILGKQYQPLFIEPRYGIIAKCKTGTILFVCFTIRNGRIRSVSARLANRKERGNYDG